MTQAEPLICTMCHLPESPERLGNFYDAVSENGMRLVHFWVCNPCAIPFGVGQGAIDPDLANEMG
ncbi:hypothetical protein D3C72_2418230 [compost metagenome]